LWPRGFNAQGLQGSVNTNDLLQELGLVYSIDDRTRDEPWIQKVNGDRDFCLVPYMGHVNDLNFFQNQQRSLADYEHMLAQEFEVLYAEGATRRRMMSVPLHDFVAGRPAVVPSVERFLRWAAGHPGVWFARRDEIADWALGRGARRHQRRRHALAAPAARRIVPPVLQHDRRADLHGAEGQAGEEPQQRDHGNAALRQDQPPHPARVRPQHRGHEQSGQAEAHQPVQDHEADGDGNAAERHGGLLADPNISGAAGSATGKRGAAVRVTPPRGATAAAPPDR
jgi:hypothetical protein